jgi:hypothetical protein
MKLSLKLWNPKPRYREPIIDAETYSEYLQILNDFDESIRVLQTGEVPDDIDPVAIDEFLKNYHASKRNPLNK